MIRRKTKQHENVNIEIHKSLYKTRVFTKYHFLMQVTFKSNFYLNAHTYLTGNIIDWCNVVCVALFTSIGIKSITFHQVYGQKSFDYRNHCHCLDSPDLLELPD